MYNLVIVDDEEKILDGIAELFPWEQIGFCVIGRFQSAVRALEFIAKDDVNVDVVMSDIEMPDMNGIELCRQLKAMGNCKVVFFSSHQNYEYFRSAIKYQVSDYLLKPLRYNELVSCMEKVRDALLEESPCEKTEIKSYYEKIVAAVQEYVNMNFKDATLEAAAEAVNLSSSYLSRIFKEKSGTGFSEYLLDVRMKKAGEMLRDIQYKSYEIAYYVGYDNPKNFSRAFKAYYGINPSEYRNHTIDI